MVVEDVQRSLGHRGQLAGRDNGINDPLFKQVFGDLDADREWFTVQCLVDSGTEEADQSTWLGDGDMTQ